MTSKFVYFLRPVGAMGPIKIGYSQVPNDRLMTIAAWSPLPLEIAAVMEGDRHLEAAFHSTFNHCRQHGEWFSATPDLLACIEKIRAGEPVVLAERRKIPRVLPAATKERMAVNLQLKKRLAAETKITGQRSQLPEDIARIMGAWNGIYRSYRSVGPRPSDAELARVRAFIASPLRAAA